MHYFLWSYIGITAKPSGDDQIPFVNDHFTNDIGNTFGGQELSNIQYGLLRYKQQS